MDTHSKPPKLMQRVKATSRVKRYNPRTDQPLPLRGLARQHGGEL